MHKIKIIGIYLLRKNVNQRKVLIIIIVTLMAKLNNYSFTHGDKSNLK